MIYLIPCTKLHEHRKAIRFSFLYATVQIVVFITYTGSYTNILRDKAILLYRSEAVFTQSTIG